MSMRLKYGSYTHPAAEVSVVITRTPLRNESDAAYAIQETWDIEGYIHEDTQVALLNKVRLLEQVYSREGQNAYLILPDNNGIAHQMISANAIGGVMITQVPSYPQGRGAEWSTYRSYTLSLKAEFPTNVAESNLLSWTESVRHQGTGGPRTILVECLNAPPQPQTIVSNTICRVTQSGSATGYKQYPSPPPPLFPAWEKVDEREIARTSPRAVNVGSSRKDVEYKVNWTYVFEMPSLIGAYPTRKPRTA